MRYTLLIIFLLSTQALLAQRPGNFEWATEADYRAEESKITKNIQWLEENPFATQINDTKSISEYILAWLASVPYLEVTMDYTLLTGIVDNPKFKYGEKFRVTYLFGKSFYYIENQSDPIEEDAVYRGVIGLVKVYRELEKFDPQIKNKQLAKFSKLQDSGKLKSYVQNRMAELPTTVEQ